MVFYFILVRGFLEKLSVLVRLCFLFCRRYRGFGYRENNFDYFNYCFCF